MSQTSSGPREDASGGSLVARVNPARSQSCPPTPEAQVSGSCFWHLKKKKQPCVLEVPPQIRGSTFESGNRNSASFEPQNLFADRRQQINC